MRRTNALLVTLAGAMLALPAVSLGSIGAGYDLFVSQTGTFFKHAGNVVPFTGLPLGTFDFGSGSQFTGDTDTIVHRTTDLATDTGVIDIEIVALSLRSVMPVPVPVIGSTYLYATLDTGASNTGTITITDYDAGTETGFFDSQFDITFNLWAGDPALGGQQIDTVTKHFGSVDSPWAREPLGTSLVPLIPGVNTGLAGGDFWPTGTIVHDSGDGVAEHHTASNVPAPAGASLVAIGIGLVGWIKRRPV